VPDSVYCHCFCNRGALRKNGPVVTVDRTISYSIGAARFAVEAKPRPWSGRSLRDYSRPRGPFVRGTTVFPSVTPIELVLVFRAGKRVLTP
jgi:hypothetical protein